MKYATETGVTVTIPENASDLEIYKACRAAGLLVNQTHSAMVYGAYSDQITVDRARDGKPLLTLDRVKVCGKVA